MNHLSHRQARAALADDFSKFNGRENDHLGQRRDELIDQATVSTAAVTAKLQLPTGVEVYKRLPADGTFTCSTIPCGLLSQHNTKADVWGTIRVVSRLSQ